MGGDDCSGLSGSFREISKRETGDYDAGRSVGTHGDYTAEAGDVSLFRSELDTFHLSGWYTSAAKDVGNRSVGYISEAKYREWGYDLEEKAELWLKTSKYMGWRKTEERLYQDLPVNQTEPGVMLEIKAQNPYAYSAVNELIGGYELAVLGALFIVTGLFFLIYNVMQISMAGDIRQMGLLHTLGMTKRQIRSVYFQQIFKALIPGVLAGTALSIFLLKVCIPRFLEKSFPIPTMLK